MSLRKLEWLRKLAIEGRVYENIATQEFLVKKAKALSLKPKAADTLMNALIDRTYRPLGGNDADLILLDTVIEVLNATLLEDSGEDILRVVKAQGNELYKESVAKVNLESVKKELFKLLPDYIKDNEFNDLVWKAAKIDEKKILLALLPLLKLNRPEVLTRSGEVFELKPSLNKLTPVESLEFGGFELRKNSTRLWIMPSKDSIESFKRTIKQLTERSMTGYSARFIAISLKREIVFWLNDFGFCTNRKLGRYLDSYIRERVYLFLLKKYNKAGKKEIYQRFMLVYPTLEGVVIPSVRPVGEPCAEKLACTVRGADD